jgi:predicted RNA-binding protein with PIN domain
VDNGLESVDNFMKMLTPPADALLFVDAYNLLHHFDELVDLLHEDPPAARTLFYREFLKLKKVDIEQLRIVVDGSRLPQEDPPSHLPIIWASAPDTADQRIIKLLLREARRQGRRRPFLVITDDRDLATKARDRGALILSCAQFIHLYAFGRIEPLPSPSQTAQATQQSADKAPIRKSGRAMSDSEVQWWMQKMQDTPDHIEPAEEKGMISYASKRPKLKSPQHGTNPHAPSREQSHSDLESSTSESEADISVGKSSKKDAPTFEHLTAEDQELARLFGLDPKQSTVRDDIDEDENWDGHDPYAK